MAAKDKEISSFRKRKLKVGEMREQMQVNRHKFFFNWLNNTNLPADGIRHIYYLGQLE